MWRVTDTITYRAKLLRDYPNLPQKEGLLAILDPDQVRAPFGEIDRVIVRKPDASAAVLEVAEVRIGAAGVVGLFFCGIGEMEIPRGSVIHALESGISSLTD
jgi:hypothetical protein